MRPGVDVQGRDGAGSINYGSGTANLEARTRFAASARIFD